MPSVALGRFLGNPFLGNPMEYRIMLRPRNMLILLALLPLAPGMQAQAASSVSNEAVQNMQFDEATSPTLQAKDDRRSLYCQGLDSRIARAKSNPGGEVSELGPATSGLRGTSSGLGRTDIWMPRDPARFGSLDNRSVYEAERLVRGCE